MRVRFSKPEFHSQPPSGSGWSRSMSRSTHSPRGEISNSLYRRMFSKSEPTKTSATSQFQSLLVSFLVAAAPGMRLSFSYGQMKRK